MIEIELIRDIEDGTPVVAVVIRHGATMLQTPFIIEGEERPARDIAKALKILFPNTPQTHVGFEYGS